MSGRGWSVHQRGRDLIKWSGAECAECSDPVEIVLLDVDPLLDDGSRVAIERVIVNRRGEPGMIAARPIAGRMHGYRITKSRPAAAGFAVFKSHLAVCEEAPPPPFEQHSLFEPTTTEESDE